MKSSRPLIASASVVLLRAATSGVELLMLRRNPSASAFGGAYVFPGGVLDAFDADPRSLRRLLGMTPSEAAGRLQVPPGADALVHWMTAVRECFEETEVLLAVDAAGRPPTVECRAQFKSIYEADGQGPGRFVECLERLQLLIDTAAMPYFAHWITPPVQPRRFNTRFFLALIPELQQPRIDGMEIVDSQWLSPAEILERERLGSMKLGSMATRSVIAEIGELATPEAVLAYASARTPVPENRPRVAQGRRGRRFLLRHDAAYAEIAWVDTEERGDSSSELEAGEPRRLDRHCRRLIAPNPGLMTGPGTNTYLIGERRVAVIDPGPDDAAHVAAIIEHAAGEVECILLTHTHSDHAPAAERLSQLTGAPILGGGPAEGTGHIAVRFDRVLGDGELVPVGDLSVLAIHTPGHASNHFCYRLESTRMLFTGDHLIQGSTVVIAPPDGKMSAYLRSLQALQLIEIAIIAPGHGYLIGEPQQEIARVIRHRLGRQEKVRQALDALGGSGDLKSLLPLVYADVTQSLHALAERSLLAHLIKLLEEGELDCAQGRWSRRGGN